MNKWKELINALSTGVLITNHDGDILYANIIAAHLLGQEPSALIGTNFSYPLAVDETQEIEILGSNLQIKTVEIVSKRGGWENHFAWIISFLDVTEQKKQRARLDVISKGFAATSQGILITDEQGTILEVNDALLNMTGYKANEMIGQKAGILKSGKKGASFYTGFWNKLISTGHWQGEIVDRSNNNQFLSVYLNINAVKNSDGEVVNYIAFYHDLRGIKEKERQIAQLKLYDLITGYANKYLLTLKLNQLITETAKDRGIILMRILITDKVSKKYDIITQDTLVLEIAKRLNQITRDRYLAARIGPKEFVLVFYGDWAPSALNQLAQALIDALAMPIHLKNKIFNLTSNIGIAVYNHYASFSVEDFLNQADDARLMARMNAVNSYAIFNSQAFIKELEFINHINAIRKAITFNELDLYYQPKVDLITEKVIGVEALLRWNHPEKGLLSPYQFLYGLDDHPVSLELGNWVLNAVLQFAERLVQQNLMIQVSYNVSSYQLQDSGFIKHVEKTFTKYPKIPRKMILHEILETETIEDIGKVTRLIDECRLKSIFFSLDDFGTGYSSLSYLKALHTNQVKLDQSFIRNILTNVEDIAILKATIELCRHLNRELIAEGVEMPTHARLLRHLGCNLIQGYTIARPMPENELIPWLRKFRLSKQYNKTLFSKNACDELLTAINGHYAELKAINRYLQMLPDITVNERGYTCPISAWLGKYESEFPSNASFNAMEEWHNSIHKKAIEIFSMTNIEQLSLAYEKLRSLDEASALFIKELLLLAF